MKKFFIHRIWLIGQNLYKYKRTAIDDNFYVYIGENKSNITIRPNFNILESELNLLRSKNDLLEKKRILKEVMLFSFAADL